jgi:hypothetical protein
LIFYFLDQDSNCWERIKNVGAHNPIKIPNLSPWAESAFCHKGLIPLLATYQTIMLAMMERNPQTKQILEIVFKKSFISGWLSLIKKSRWLIEA